MGLDVLTAEEFVRLKMLDREVDCEKYCRIWGATYEEYHKMYYVDLEELARIYPEGFGKINCRRGFLLARERERDLKKEWKFDSITGPFMVDIMPIPVKPAHMKLDALNRFKNLVHLTAQLRNTNGLTKAINGVQRFTELFSEEDRALCLPLIEWYRASTREEKNNVHFLFRRLFFNIKQSIAEEYSTKEFIHCVDASLYEVAQKTTEDLSLHLFYLFDLKELPKGKEGVQRYGDCLSDEDRIWLPYIEAYCDPDRMPDLKADENEWFQELAERLAEKISLHLNSISNFVDKFYQELDTLKKELSIEKNQLNVNITDGQLVGLSARRNDSVKSVTDNQVGCCITGSAGISRDATIISWLDPAVHLWEFRTFNDNYSRDLPEIFKEVFGLALLIETEGNHVSAPHDPQKYLVFEGLIANQNYYARIGKLRFHQHDGKIEREGVHAKGKEVQVSFPNFVYNLALRTAKELGIKKLFINTEHSGRQFSVEDFAREVAQEYIEHRGIWGFKGRKFKLKRDTVSRSSFAQFADSNGQIIYDKGGKPFEYTHFLRKPSLSGSIVQAIERDASWSGEEYFDTWYGWNKFIMETYPKWSEELRKQHPYAESVAKRGKDPQWNLGIGYCKGFEVDVEMECKRLGMSKDSK